MKITSVDFVKSAFNRSQFPKDRFPQIAFGGRSNVGKSSLLNRLAGRRIARISGTPGKTRSINFFLVNQKFYFVDLPGYGYARVSKSMRESWGKLIEGYIEQTPDLKAVVLIIDSRRDEIPPADLRMVEYLAAVDVPCIPVLTKIDKLSRSARARVKKLHTEQLPPESPPALFSAVTREGLPELRKRIADHLA